MRNAIEIGDKSIFAIESRMSKAYARPRFLALGYFVLHVRGNHYGVLSPDASLLACSLDEVKKRIKNRGKHSAPFSTETNPARIADAFREAIYADKPLNEGCFGISWNELKTIIYKNGIQWAPDGDEAFDDGSYVLHFDVGSLVRLIAFRTQNESWLHDPKTLSEVWIEANVFYGILEKWIEAFQAEWTLMGKESD